VDERPEAVILVADLADDGFHLGLVGGLEHSTRGIDQQLLGEGAGQLPPTLNIPSTHYCATVLLGLTLPIYDGGLRRALEGQARANEARTSAALEQTRDEATREIVGAANRVRTSLAALDAADALASAAQITFDAALAAYRHGVGSITDTTRASTGLLEAQNASTDAYSAALSSAATLALAAGTLGAAPE